MGASIQFKHMTRPVGYEMLHSGQGRKGSFARWGRRRAGDAAGTVLRLRDTGTSVDDTEYQVPFAFDGKLQKITFDLGESSMTPEAIKAMMEELAKKRDR
jgi:hypothetical protein